MFAVRAIIGSLFGPAAQADPALWQRGAYLALIGSVVGTLMDRHKEMTTQELVHLAKVLEAVSPMPNGSKAKASPGPGVKPEASSDVDGRHGLPGYFSEVLQQIYGAAVAEEQTPGSG